jgi:hypothetical protein
MERGTQDETMLAMSAPSVTESPIRLEPVTADPFIDDLSRTSAETEARLARLARRGLEAPHRTNEPPRPRTRRRLGLRIRPHIRPARTAIA